VVSLQPSDPTNTQVHADQTHKRDYHGLKVLFLKGLVLGSAFFCRDFPHFFLYTIK